MSAILRMSKPIGRIAAILGVIQGLSWFVLALLAVLSYNCAIDATYLENEGVSQPSDTFLINLLDTYFTGDACKIGTPLDMANTLKPSEMHVWMIIIMVFNFIWMSVSIYYLIEIVRLPKPVTATLVYVGVASAVLILDLAATIRFGVNYGTVLGIVNDDAATIETITALTCAAFMMAMAARGYILWLVNDGLLIFLITAIITGHKVSKASTRNLSRQASFTNPTVNHMWPDDDDKTYQQPAASSAVATRDAWDPPTPTQTRPLYPYSAASQPRSLTESSMRYNAPQNYSTQPQQQPVLILQNPPQTRSPPPHQGYSTTPKHIPDPDYSPELDRHILPPVVLRKPPARIANVGRTVF